MLSFKKSWQAGALVNSFRSLVRRSSRIVLTDRIVRQVFFFFEAEIKVDMIKIAIFLKTTNTIYQKINCPTRI